MNASQLIALDRMIREARQGLVVHFNATQEEQEHLRRNCDSVRKFKDGHRYTFSEGRIFCPYE